MKTMPSLKTKTALLISPITSGTQHPRESCIVITNVIFEFSLSRRPS